jgi:WD40 repeat protein
MADEMASLVRQVASLREEIAALRQELRISRAQPAAQAGWAPPADSETPAAPVEPGLAPPPQEPVPDTGESPLRSDRPVLPPTLLKKARLVLRETFEHNRFLGHAAVEDALFISKGRFITLAADRKARLWGVGREPAGLLEELLLPAQPLFAACQREQRLLAAGLDDGAVLLWDAGERLRQRSTRLDMAEEIGALAFSAGGTALALGSVSGQLAVFDLDGGLLFSDDLCGDLDALAFSPDGAYLACGLSRGSLLLRRAAGFEPAGEADIPGNPSLAFDSRSRFVCCAGVNGQVEVLALPGLERLLSFGSMQPEPILRLALSPNSELLATATESGAVTLWRTGDGRLLERVEAHRAQVFGLDFDPAGRSLLSASYDGRALVWEIK